MKLNKIEEHCKRCNKVTMKRFVKDTGNGYYSCSLCLEDNSKRYRKKNWTRYLAQKANTRKKEGSEKLTEEDIESLIKKQDNRCSISGVLFDIESKWNKPSLDRIDNSRGYTRDNIQLVTWIINHSRGELSVEEFIEMCTKVAKHQVK